MPRVRAIIGHVSVEAAKRARECCRQNHGPHKHSIAKDELCLVIKEPEGGKANYCLASASEILDRAEDELAAIRTDLGL